MSREFLNIQMAKRIARSRCDVFMRADFADLGGYDQIGRVGMRTKPTKMQRVTRSKTSSRSEPSYLSWRAVNGARGQ